MRGRYKTTAPPWSPVAVTSEGTPLLTAHAHSSSDWESTDESFCSLEISSLNNSICSTNTADETVTPVRVSNETDGPEHFTPEGTSTY